MMPQQGCLRSVLVFFLGLSYVIIGEYCPLLRPPTDEQITMTNDVYICVGLYMGMDCDSVVLAVIFCLMQLHFANWQAAYLFIYFCV